MELQTMFMQIVLKIKQRRDFLSFEWMQLFKYSQGTVKSLYAASSS